jgi:hypothetical protein
MRSRCGCNFAIPPTEMKIPASLGISLLALAVFHLLAEAAIPVPPAGVRATERTVADARAEQALAPARTELAAPVPSGGGNQTAELRREMVEQSNLVSARFEQVDAKLYEIVGRLQLLTACLIALFLGVFVWQISLTRQIGALKAARRAATPASGRLG